jgi:long-chain acyl-CoA synthetase
LYKLLGIKIIEGYGLTETSPVVSFNPPQRIKFGSVGKPIPDVQIKIFHPDVGGIGQVLIKGPNVMQGYFKHPDWTESVIKEGWFYSGDLGYIDKEGYLFLVGREKEVIVLSSGKNIYPEELEEYFSKSPYIKEICIVAYKEEKFGRPIESLHAVVVPHLEYFRQTNETNIRAKIRWELENLGKNLPSYQHIMGFTVTKEELPRTALKKIKRYQVREGYLGEKAQFYIAQAVSPEEDLGSLNKDVAQKVINYVSGQLRKPVYLDSHLEIDLGIDSLTRVELGLGLEEILKIKIPDEVLYSSSTVKEIITNITELTDKGKPLTEKAADLQRNWSQILSQIPQQEILAKIRIEPRWIDRLLTGIFKSIFLFLLRIFWFLRIKGRDNLPAQGPYIICSNHASYLDGFVIFSSVKLNQALHLFFLGYSAIFEHPLINWATKVARLISIDPNLHLTQALQAASYILKQKRIVCIFPEGRRSVDQNLGEFKKGIGILLKELNVAVIPVYIQGSHYSWPRTSRLPRLFRPLKIIFGQPLSKKELLSKTEAVAMWDDYGVIAQRLKEEVVKLACPGI